MVTKTHNTHGHLAHCSYFSSLLRGSEKYYVILLCVKPSNKVYFSLENTIFLSTEAVQAAVTTGTIWLFLTILTRFILHTDSAVMVSQILGICFVILPIVNHIGIFIAIRGHNNQVADTVSEQNLSVLFRREKKAAIDMLIVIAVLLVFLAPAIFVNMFRRSLLDIFEVLYAWTAALTLFNSAINPVIYLVRNGDIRSAIRSMMSF